MARGPHRITVVEDSPAPIRGRAVATIDGIEALLTPDDVSSIAVWVYELDSEGTPSVVSGFSGASITVDDVMLDTERTHDDDPAWPAELGELGYNFLHHIGGDAFPNGSRTYKVEYKLTLTGGAVVNMAPIYVDVIPITHS